MDYETFHTGTREYAEIGMLSAHFSIAHSKQFDCLQAAQAGLFSIWTGPMMNYSRKSLSDLRDEYSYYGPAHEMAYER